MERLVLLAALMLVPLVAEAEAPKQNGAKLVECSGNTNITVSGRTGARTPFHGVFKIEGETVTMIEGDVTRFPRSYTEHPELTKPDRPGYQAPDRDGNLFFYNESGRFIIVRFGPTKVGKKAETTEGVCKPFVKSKVFD